MDKDSGIRSARFDPLEFCVPGLRALKPYEPGKPISELERELGISDIVKLASNENPLGPSPRALAAMHHAIAEVALYPDGNAHALKQALAVHHGIAPERIVVGSGSDHLIELVARAFLAAGRSAVVAQYGFAIYAIVARAAGAELRIAAARSPSDSREPYGHDPQTLRDAVDEATRVVFLANPNNPTGTWLRRPELEALLGAIPPDTIVVLDEAYCDYVAPFEREYADSRALLDAYPNLVVLRTFSKAYGLAGIRAGYALADPMVADLLNRVRLSFNPSSVAQAGAVAALADRDHLKRTVEHNHGELRRLAEGLRKLGLACIPSVCNFVAADVGRDGRELFRALLGEGIITRPLDGYGLPRHLRFSVGLAEQNERLMGALGRILAQ
ncbi:MAG TPA: histidinol-phosphate transaminase [Gammaproteobacteria bacterium]|nr:histidinol-phosphate transaminase [Gammaproteobacteria bacterium]